MSTDPNIGRLLRNRYLLGEMVGKGAMGRVYKAKDKLLGGVIVAVKFLSQALLNNKMRERFEKEATICALLGSKSNHIVDVRDYGVDEHEISYYVMEYLEGESLSDVIRSQPIPLPRFLNISRQICFGLQCAHKGIVYEGKLTQIIHRDIKPSNILIVQDSSFGELVKILDFGIAKLIQSDSAQTQSFMGTLAYCSPEQMEGKELDPRSDIYSLGVMMFEMLTGEMPIVSENRSFGGWYKAHHETPPRSFESINTLTLKLPKALETLVMRCLAKDRNERPQSVEEILKALEPLEQRFGQGWQLGQRIGAALSKLPIVEESSKSSVGRIHTVEEICRQTSWPKNKPKKAIVFPHIIRHDREELATLWVMLSQQDIENHQVSRHYNQFLFLSSPHHPMVLWITALHNRNYGTRWLTCYLDLKTDLGQKIVRLLGKAGCYRILFFALSQPERCANVTTSTIVPAQRKLLVDWANTSQTSPSGQAELSKKILKQELDKLKDKILRKLEAIDSDYPSNISG